MAKHDAARSALVVVGNSQAEAVACALRAMERVTSRFRVEFAADGHVPAESREPGSLLLACPDLSFRVPWPLAVPNPLNRPEPPDFPAGPFPYADAFLQACVLGGTGRPQMLRLYFQETWSDSWPDLDSVLAAESARLLDLDRESGLTIGAFVLAAFRETRLFFNPDAPSDALLGELVRQLLAPVFPGEDLDDEIRGAFASLGTRDCMGTFALPIHPNVARHFSLSWVSPLTLFNYFDREQLTDREYYRRYIDHVQASVVPA